MLLATAAVLAACEGASAERQVLTAFFHAARVRDPILLGRVSTLTLNSQLPGAVSDFTITGVSGDAGTRYVTVWAEGTTFRVTLNERDGGWVVSAVK